jgi:hypothetical protein
MSLGLFPLPVACSAGTAEPSRPISAGSDNFHYLVIALSLEVGEARMPACPSERCDVNLVVAGELDDRVKVKRVRSSQRSPHKPCPH